MDGDSRPPLWAAFTSREAVSAARLDEAFARLPEDARPAVLMQLPSIALTDGFRPRRHDLPREPAGVVYRVGASGAYTV